MTVFGTRPEAIKMCPLLKTMDASRGIESRLCVSGQHEAMLEQVLKSFGVQPDYNLRIMKEQQSLTSITAAVLEGLEPILKTEAPDLVLVHGDTTTSMSAALAAFYQQIPIGHVEAGLRTGNIYSPFPEEMNRRILTDLASYHFSPTPANKKSLISEGIKDGVFVTGNTVIDAFQYTIKPGHSYKNSVLKLHDFSRRTILMTAHRRENHGIPLVNICNAVLDICKSNPNVSVIYPVHYSPSVRDVVFSHLSNHPQIFLTDPVDILDMHNAISQSYLVLTDSGGLQEEVPYLGKPVVVLRDNTERPEAVEAGTAILAGTERELVFSIVNTLLNDEKEYLRMSTAINPYGDGHASERIVSAIERNFTYDEYQEFAPAEKEA